MLTGSSSPGEGGAGEEPRSQDFVLVTWWLGCQLSTNHFDTLSFPYTLCPLHLFLPIAKLPEHNWTPFHPQVQIIVIVMNIFSGKVCHLSYYLILKCKPWSSSQGQWIFFLLKWESFPSIILFSLQMHHYHCHPHPHQGSEPSSSSSGRVCPPSLSSRVLLLRHDPGPPIIVQPKDQLSQ